MGEQLNMESRAPRKARAILKNLIESRQMTPSGLKWLEIATDPFHDVEIRSDGYPDMISTRSIVQTITKTTTVNAPSGVTGNWDLHLFFAPLTPTFTQSAPLLPPPYDPDGFEEDSELELEIQERDGKQSLKLGNSSKVEKIPEEKATSPAANQGYWCHSIARNGECIYQNNITNINSGWNAINVVGGANWQTSLGNNDPSISIPTDYSGGAWRLIGTGLEVVNTTAQLYKGGSVTAYRSPSPNGEAQLHFNVGDSLDPFYVPNICRMNVTPPAVQSDAALYPNSKTFGADEGVYLIATMNSTDNPYYVPKPNAAGMMIPRSTSDLLAGNGWLAWLPTVGNTLDPLTSLSNTLPFDISGAIFTGLNVNSAMQVTVRYYIERNPTVADPNLLVLARTPCPFDPVALEIYTRCMEELPVGVPVKMNPLGEWFTEVLQGIGEWAPKIGQAVGNIIPGGGLIGNILGTAAQGINMARGTKVTEKTTPGGKTTVTVQKARKKKKKRAQVAVVAGPPAPSGGGARVGRRRTRVRVKKPRAAYYAKFR